MKPNNHQGDAGANNPRVETVIDPEATVEDLRRFLARVSPALAAHGDHLP